MRRAMGNRWWMKLLVATLILTCSATLARQLWAGGPEENALQQLQEGNARFVAGATIHPDLGADRRGETAKNGQHPFATVIACSDSRVPVELLFDRGVGDIFTIRVAGNVCDSTEIGSTEYGVEHLGTPLVVVMGHTKCGAVTAAASGAEATGGIAKIMDLIRPAVARASQDHPGLTGDELVEASVRANVLLSMEQLLQRSAAVREAVEKEHVRLVGAVYHLDSGRVEWLGAHPNQAHLLEVASAEPR